LEFIAQRERHEGSASFFLLTYSYTLRFVAWVGSRFFLEFDRNRSLDLPIAP